MNLGAPIIGADVKLLTVSMITDPSNKNTQDMTVEYLPTGLPNKKQDPVLPVVSPVQPSLVNPTPSVITLPPIYNNTIIQITKQRDAEPPKASNALIIAAIVAVVLVVLLSIGIFLYYKRCFAKAEAGVSHDGI